MSELVKNICVYLVVGLLLHGLSVWLRSDFLGDFLTENLIILLFALLAINTTTISVIMTKLRDITGKSRVGFGRTTKAMKNSILEQLVLIVVAAVALVVKESDVISAWWGSSGFVLNVILVAVFVWAVHVLYDTANGIFVILEYEESRDE